MHLLVAVINQPEKLDEILVGFVELGVRGATVIQSEGMGRVLSHDIPIFAGLQTLISQSRPDNRTIFSVLSDELVDPVISPASGSVRRPGVSGHRNRIHDSPG